MTLLEALVVVALTAMLALVAFPNVEKSYGVFTLHETADVLTANLRIAHADAMSKGEDVDFALQGDGHGYSWSEGEARRTPASVGLSMSKGQSIRFFADGSSSGGAIALANGSRRIEIGVDDATGTTTVIR